MAGEEPSVQDVARVGREQLLTLLREGVKPTLRWGVTLTASVVGELLKKR